MAGSASILLLLIVGVVIYFFFIRKRKVPSTSTSPTIGGGPQPATGTSGADNFGITKLYPDATPVKYSGTTGGGGIEHQTMSSTGKHVDRREWEIRGPAFLNQEVTVYFNYAITNPDTMSMKLRGGPHSGNACACNYIHYIPVNGDDHIIGGQCPHLNYVKGGKALFQLPNLASKWVGAKAVEWNEGNGVRLQTWVDLTGTPPGRWQKWVDVVDTGQFGITPMTKSPWSCAIAEILLRTDFEAGGDSQAKFISAREIAPPAGAGGGGTGGAPAPAPAPAAAKTAWQIVSSNDGFRNKRRIKGMAMYPYRMVSNI